jgi:hypothetical protein
MYLLTYTTGPSPPCPQEPLHPELGGEPRRRDQEAHCQGCYPCRVRHGKPAR